MALKIPKLGLPQMLKEGFKHFQGMEEAVFRNIQACKELSRITRTSFGPNGLSKMVINHLEKLFVTNDAATIIKELEVIHPAAKMVVFASQQQEADLGDGINLVIILAGELLGKAEDLLKMGLPLVEVIDGYDKACKLAVGYLNDLVAETITNVHDKKQISKAIHSAISSKQYGYEHLLTNLIAQACVDVMPTNPKQFNVGNIRNVKIIGGSIHDSTLVKGMVLGREPEGAVQRCEKAKVAVFSCPLEISKTETKGTVLIHSAKEMLNFSTDEERLLDQQFREIAESGAKILVTGGSVSDSCLHFIDRYQLMCIKVLSKFDLRRLCTTTGASALARLGAPTPEEMGYVHVAEVIEIGSDRCTVFRQENEESEVTTIVIRGASRNTMDDIERAIDDAVNVAKGLTKDPRMTAGAGATEIELARRLHQYAATVPGLEQYSIKKFAETLEVVPRTLAENAGMDPSEIISKLYAAHEEGKLYAGVDIENEQNGIVDATKKNILDLLIAKAWAIRYATQAVNTVLCVDQIIMSKPAGGPKPRDNPNWDED